MIYIKFLIIIFLSTVIIGCKSDSSDDAVFIASSTQTIALNGFDALVDENASAGTYVGAVTFDENSSLITDIKLYGISATFFNVDINGTVRVSSRATFNSKIKELYTLEAIATNETDRSNRASLTIRVADLNIPRLDSFSASIDENVSGGFEIGVVEIFSNGNSPITSMRLSGENADSFEIDENGTIILSALASINYDTKNLYTLDVRATNASGESLPREVIITINQIGASNTPNARELPLVLIAIGFNDYPIRDSALNWYNKIFGTAYGEINHYYREVSNGRFQVIPAIESSGTANDGIIKVSLGINHPGNNSMNNSHLADAIARADADIDFSMYDTNINGVIEVDELQIMFIVGGGETAYGDPVGSSTWAHASGLSAHFSNDNEPPPIVDGVSVMDYFANGKYSRFGEMQGSHFATIGIIVHELGHAIWGLPDLYDTDQSSAGIGYFGLMASGSWTAKNGEYPGATPPHMCAWSKLQLDWVDPQVVSVTTNNIAMHATHTTSNNIVKVPTSNPNEYFLIENRSPAGYDGALFRLQNIDFEGGIAIWHIDEAKFSNDDETHKLVDLEEANAAELDTSPYNKGKRANLFYVGNSTLFNNSSLPNSREYGGSVTNISVNNISVIGTAAEEYIVYIDVTR